ncbi:hypothetical protein LV75_000654 [Actinokineospora diospyrosa]|uniref:Uncharacterized protein n=2 Tax=Actinokineospora diospyrosa TaxID=103728 RepID=A0ABT1I6B5_9PSEU|nr:hypothetical protein [Actinokineospora diospyrosa]
MVAGVAAVSALLDEHVNAPPLVGVIVQSSMAVDRAEVLLQVGDSLADVAEWARLLGSPVAMRVAEQFVEVSARAMLRRDGFLAPVRVWSHLDDVELRALAVVAGLVFKAGVDVGSWVEIEAHVAVEAAAAAAADRPWFSGRAAS